MFPVNLNSPGLNAARKSGKTIIAITAIMVIMGEGMAKEEIN